MSEAPLQRRRDFLGVKQSRRDRRLYANHTYGFRQNVISDNHTFHAEVHAGCAAREPSADQRAHHAARRREDRRLGSQGPEPRHAAGSLLLAPQPLLNVR